MVMKVCIVAWFDSANYFQWFVALKKHSEKFGITVSSLNASPLHVKVHNDFMNDQYWQPLREADLVFVYATRIASRQEPTGITWWTLPQFVKLLMKPEAKMIAQYDDEFMWLFDSKHIWWRFPNPDNHGGPEQFFKDTKILEVPDAHLTVMNDSPFKKYTTKPVFKLLLPQLFRYRFIQKYSEKHEGQSIAMMLHSIKQSSIHGILENVVKPMNYSVRIFSGTLDRDAVVKFHMAEELPVNSEMYARLDYESYMDLLWLNCSIGLDDNVGYYGWSRFVMECALAFIPCIGSSEATQDIFPELYTKPQDYVKQIELIERLRTDKKFYHKMAELGHRRVLELFDDEKLCTRLLDIFKSISPSTSQVSLSDVLGEKNSRYNPDKQQARPHP